MNFVKIKLVWLAEILYSHSFVDNEKKVTPPSVIKLISRISTETEDAQHKAMEYIKAQIWLLKEAPTVDFWANSNHFFHILIEKREKRSS